MENRHQQILLESQIISLIRILKHDDVTITEKRRLLEEAKQHVLFRALKYLTDGRDYYIKIIQQVGDVEYPSFVDFVEYKTTCFLLLLDPEQCHVGELLIIKQAFNTHFAPAAVTEFTTESKRRFKLVNSTDEYCVWQRISSNFQELIENDNDRLQST